jgi:glycosyltransferase involved in cell wall biosynthesis
MRIAVVEPTSQGGLLHYAFQLADALAEHGNEVDLLVPAHNELVGHEGPARRRAVLASPIAPPTGTLARVASVKLVRRSLVAGRLMQAWARINWELRPGRYDAAILTSDVDLPPVALAALALTVGRGGMRVAGIGHSARPLNRWSGAHLFVSSPVLDTLLRTLYRRLDVLFVHGERSRAEFQEAWSPRTLVVIPHGDERLFGEEPPAPAAEKRLLFFGDWRKVKGLPVLMHAFDELLARVPEARLTIAGTPCPEDLDPAQVRRWADGHGERVRVIDHYVPVSEVAAVFGTARAVVTPYLVAFQSGVVHLAMTMARPVVASTVGDLPSVVVEGETGLTVPPEDPGALAGALARILEDPALAERLGAEGRRRLLESASWRAVAEAMERALAPGAAS